MEMSKSQKDRLLKFLGEKWGDKPCPMCGHIGWQLHDCVYEVKDFAGIGVFTVGQVAPVALVSCTDCGNTVMINAIAAKVVDKDGKLVKDETG